MLKQAIESIERKGLYFFPDQTKKYKKVVVFGAGTRSLPLPEELNIYGVETLFFLDNDSSKHGKSHAGLEVKNPNDVSIDDDTAILISSTFWEDIYFQCRALGFPNIFFDYHYEYRSRPWGLQSQYEKLEEFYAMLSDDESRETFAGFLKSHSTGDLTWARVSSYRLLLHPIAGAQKGDVIVEVGTGQGKLIKSVYDEFDGDCTVYTFEADPVHCEDLKHKLGDLENLTFEPMAIGKEPGTITFSRPRGTLWGGPVSNDSEESESINITTTSIDAYCDENNISPDLLWIGTQYMTADILEGLRKTFLKHRPRVSITATLSSIPDIVSFLKALNLGMDVDVYVGSQSFVLDAYFFVFVKFK